MKEVIFNHILNESSNTDTQRSEIPHPAPKMLQIQEHMNIKSTAPCSGPLSPLCVLDLLMGCTMH